MKKVVLILGIIGALIAAEGLNRIGSFVSAFGGEDSPFYLFSLIVAVFASGVLLLALFNKTNSIIKWITLVLLLGCCGMMMNAPGLPVMGQIIMGLIMAIIACLFISKIKEVSS